MTKVVHWSRLGAQSAYHTDGAHFVQRAVGVVDIFPSENDGQSGVAGQNDRCSRFSWQQARRNIKPYRVKVFGVSVRVQQGGSENGEKRQQASESLMRLEGQRALEAAFADVVTLAVRIDRRMIR